MKEDGRISAADVSKSRGGREQGIGRRPSIPLRLNVLESRHEEMPAFLKYCSNE